MGEPSFKRLGGRIGAPGLKPSSTAVQPCRPGCIPLCSLSPYLRGGDDGPPAVTFSLASAHPDSGPFSLRLRGVPGEGQSLQPKFKSTGRVCVYL